MKKCLKRLFGLLMTLCIMGTCFVPSASAADVVAANLEDVLAATDGAASSGNTSDLYYIPVSSGVRVGINSIKVAPARYDANTKDFVQYSDVSLSAYYPADDRVEFFQITPEQTESILAEFKAKDGEDANAWALTVSFTVFTDGAGSYGKYFQFTPDGTCLDANPITVPLSRSTVSFIPPAITARFLMPANTSDLYKIGLTGGCYYYSAGSRQELGTMAGVTVCFNSTVPNT